ncbi:Crp/Fnr family transcriptional regulator [Pedobacter deserti]|uniref:Crp/Fnr family transcriptional regulator n=1 Tax=Pedobacter deserti TaxID=2817382 RepID=UPI00210B14B0|nr:cyclic nucleotide-binding domain-containing protein [Pedobacter sp. SYSU D00382]
MPKRKLTNMLGAMHPMSKQLRSLLEDDNTLRKQVIKKGDKILMPKMMADEAHYIASGAFKGYYMNEENEPETFYIWTLNDIMLLPEEFFAGLQNQTVHIVALDDSEIYTITKAQMDVIYSKYPEAMVYTNMIRNEMHRWRMLHTAILMKRPNLRYDLFYSWFHRLWLLNLPDREIRWFLGICQKTLTTGKRELVLRDRGRR